MSGLKLLDLIILVFYFIVTIVIGVASTRLIRNREDFLLGGRRFGKAMMIMFAFGAGTHADTAVVVSSQSYKVGFAGIWYQWVMLFTLPIYWILAPIFRRARVLTTADFFERRFGTNFMLLYAIFGLFVNIGYVSVMLYGTGRLTEALTGNLIPWQWAILIIAGVSFLYGIAGGLIAAVWNDFFQGLLTIVMSLMIIPFFWARIGGLDGFQSHLADPQETFRLVLASEMTLYWIVMVTLVSLCGMVAEPTIICSMAAAKREMDSRIGFVGGMILKRLMTIPWALAGVMAIALFGPKTIHPDHAFGTLARELLPTGFVGLMLACVVASVMDNCAVMMLSFAGLYTDSIHKKFVNPQANETQMVFMSRIAAVAFAITCIALSYVFSDVPAAMRFLMQTVPLMGIPFFFAILWRRANRYGAFASFFAALFAMFIGKYVFHWQGDYGLPRVITLFLSAGILAGIIVSLVTPPEKKHLLDWFYLPLKTPIGQEDVLRSVGYEKLEGADTFDPPKEVTSDHDVKIDQVIKRIDNRQSRKSAIYGFVVVTFLMFSILALGKLLATWLANG